MLSRLDSAQLVPAGPRAARGYKSLPPPPGGDTSSSGSGNQTPRNVHQRPAADAECCEADWTEVLEGPQPTAVASAARAQQIQEAYRATDPIQPRPGLFLRLRA